MTHIAKDTAPVQEPCQYAVDVAMPEYRCVGKCQYAAQPAPVQEPIGYLFQHEETGLTTVVDVQQVEWGFEKNNPRHQKIGPVYTTPPAAQRQHVTDGSLCWCEPETSYTDPETGASVIVHKGPQ